MRDSAVVHDVWCDYDRALELLRQTGDRYYEAQTLTNLGDTHNQAGYPDAAYNAWHQALDILDELDHPDAQNVRAKIRVLTG